MIARRAPPPLVERRVVRHDPQPLSVYTTMPSSLNFLLTSTHNDELRRVDHVPRDPLEEHPILLRRLAHGPQSLLRTKLKIEPIQSDASGPREIRDIACRRRRSPPSRNCLRLARLFPSRQVPLALGTGPCSWLPLLRALDPLSIPTCLPCTTHISVETDHLSLRYPSFLAPRCPSP